MCERERERERERRERERERDCYVLQYRCIASYGGGGRAAGKDYNLSSC